MSAGLFFQEGFAPGDEQFRFGSRPGLEGGQCFFEHGIRERDAGEVAAFRLVVGQSEISHGLFLGGAQFRERGEPHGTRASGAAEPSGPGGASAFGWARDIDAAGIKPLLMSGGFPSTLTVIANGLEAATTPVADLGDGTAKFVDDAGFSASLDMIRDLAAAKCFDPKEMAGVDPWSTALSEFKAGNFAMLPQGAWNIGSFRESKDLDFTFGPVPSQSSVGVAADLFGIGWALSAAGKHQDEATKFIEFFAKTENLQVLLDAESSYSPFTDGASGLPAEAANYDAARANGGTRNYPFALLQWPTALDVEMGNSLSGFLLDLDQDNSAILERWDNTVEDNL